MNKVKITARKDNGKVFTQSLNEDGSPKLDKNGNPYGVIRVENPAELSLGYAYGGDNIKRGQSALIPMTVEAYEKNKAHYVDGAEFPGRVRIIENLEGGPGFKAKMAGSGDDAQACTFGGQQIFRKTEFDPTGKKEDVLIAHDNVIVGSSVKSSEEALNG